MSEARRSRFGSAWLCAVWILILAAARSGATPVSDRDSLLRSADAPRHALREGVIRILASVEQDGAVDRATLDVYVGEADQALCVFLDGKLGGRRIVMAADKVWLIMPGTTHPIRVSPNQRLFGGASIGDVARLRFADEFTATVTGERRVIDGVSCLTVSLAGRTRHAAYGSGTLWIGKDDGLPRRALLALPSGKLAKELLFTAYGNEDGKVVLRRLEIHHLLPTEHGLVTTLDFVSYDAQPVPQGLFDPEQVRTVSLPGTPARSR